MSALSSAPTLAYAAMPGFVARGEHHRQHRFDRGNLARNAKAMSARLSSAVLGPPIQPQASPISRSMT
jgi:hypothetical protein